jgi:hypothetical protein
LKAGLDGPGFALCIRKRRKSQPNIFIGEYERSQGNQEKGQYEPLAIPAQILGSTGLCAVDFIAGYPEANPAQHDTRIVAEIRLIVPLIR